VNGDRKRAPLGRGNPALGAVVRLALVAAATAVELEVAAAAGQSVEGTRPQRDAPKEVPSETEKVTWSNGYWYSHFLSSPAGINWSAYTHIVHVSKLPRIDGSLVNDGWRDPATLISLARQHKVKVLLGIGGANAGVGRSIRSTWPSGRAIDTMVASAISLMKTHGYDGIDLDREDDGSESAYYATVSAFRKALKAHPGKSLTCVTGDFLLSQFTARSGALCDQVNLMAYHNSASSPRPDDFASLVGRYLRAGFMQSKLGMGFGMGDAHDRREVDIGAAECAAKASWAYSNGLGGFQTWGMGYNAGWTSACEGAFSRWVPTGNRR
jgi:hypothetical protein